MSSKTDGVLYIITAMQSSIATNWRSNKAEFATWLELLNEVAVSGKWMTDVDDWGEVLSVLRKSIGLLSVLGDDHFAFWIIVPIYRLILEILVTFGCNVAEPAKKDNMKWSGDMKKSKELSSIMQMLAEIPTDSSKNATIVNSFMTSSTQCRTSCQSAIAWSKWPPLKKHAET